MNHRPASSRTPIVVLALATIAITLGLLFLVVSRQLRTHYETLEGEDAIQHSERLAEAVRQDLDRLAPLVDEWGVWDDAYQFAEDHNEEFVEVNLQVQSFVELEVNVLLILDAKGEPLFADAVDLETEEEIPFPDDLVAALGTAGRFTAEADPAARFSGLIMLPSGPLLVASRPILPSDGTGPARGTMLLGRYLDQPLVDRIAAAVHFPVSLVPFTAAGNAGELRPVVQPLLDTAAAAQRLDDQSIACFRLLRDTTGKPAVVLRGLLPRAIYRRGLESRDSLLFAILITGLVQGAVIVWLLQRLQRGEQDHALGAPRSAPLDTEKTR